MLCHHLPWVLHLQDREFRCCLQYWLGVTLHSNPFPCLECRSTANSMGDHQVGCGRNGSRHNVLFSTAQSATLAPSQGRPTFCSPIGARVGLFQQLTLVEAASTPGHALQVGTRRKLASNLSACRAVGAECIPLLAETLGGLSEDSILNIRAIGRAIGLRTSSPDPSISSKHLFGRVAIILWCGNASLRLHRHPTLPPSLDGVV